MAPEGHQVPTVRGSLRVWAGPVLWDGVLFLAGVELIFSQWLAKGYVLDLC